ncbi:MAG: desulfoferrodoxin [Oscillospiraceae bacterium]|jgi:superoxide reductase|nr:desulfoferrodoxin [Oscillospiraceae bacterium]
MMSGIRFFRCKHCGNLAGLIVNAGVPMICCGEKMQELIPNTSDGAQEKHVPVVKVEGEKIVVEISSVEHPMLPEHHIQWIYLKTEQGGQRKELGRGQAPKAVFALAAEDKAVAAYEYCNLHGLWKAEV